MREETKGLGEESKTSRDFRLCESLDRSKPAPGYVGQGGTDAPPETNGRTTTIPPTTVVEFFD